MYSLQSVYDTFFMQVTDDMYMEISKEQTEKDLLGLFLASLPLFEFPNPPIDLVQNENGEYSLSRELTLEEVNILAMGMIEIWLRRQVDTIELTRQKFTGADFKVTSQAAHLSRLNTMLTNTKDEHRRLQMLYSRRRRNPTTNRYESNFDLFVKRMH